MKLEIWWRELVGLRERKGEIGDDEPAFHDAQEGAG
jgi:hypothetical protein